jgi:hypothetical protein
MRPCCDHGMMDDGDDAMKKIPKQEPKDALAIIIGALSLNNRIKQINE